MTIQYYTDSVRQNHADARADLEVLGAFETWIDGEWAPAANGETFETIDPVVQEPICSVPRCGAADVDRAVESAQSAFDATWGSLGAADRSRAILAWTETLREHIDELALVESLDGGKPLSHARAEIEFGIEFIEYYANVVRADEGITLPTSDDQHVYTRTEPYGVVGLIVPWNYAFIIAAWKLGPALAAGNAVVLKPAEQTPLSALYAAKLSKSIFPDGVVNVLTGYGEEAGAALSSHPTVGKLSFTGADTTGETIMETAASTVTPVTLELGGKSPYVVFPDVDIDETVRDVAHGIFYNAGQSCDACSRLLVHEDIAEEFLDALVDRAESLEVGDTLQEGTTLGPIISQAQFETVTGYLERGTDAGATLETGGVADESPVDDGWFVEPTVFTDATNDMQIAQEEIFGPVLTVITFSTYEEAVDLANDVPFGLAAGVATSDIDRAHRAAADIDAGSIWVNGSYATPRPGGPFGGFKRSGIGRELSKDALRHYTQEKTVYVSVDDPSR
ncbi:aldehyde dehydrogenase [Salinadaptatus halalkaliphilus]|uniref:Aldehyde dehydrogenase n=1 Tax=Salinadaptatus halalkaliphilus TaxID=2419781 RepID=A0A4S3TKB6_9EURY|nr:aldehyde dehydrogenase family protein [Salinadaptatus halalkaliphilus]THE63018.1 aldehyde dehydrogenase [Salinadaptatus halalkaliphilus]